MEKLLLIDGNSVLFRAYYATLYGRMMRTSNGIPTNAVYGFITMVNKAMELIQPDHILVAWDSGQPTFRHEMYEEYKGTRKSLDEDLKVQFSIVREYLDAMDIPRYEQDGIEADDIIGSMSKQCGAKEVCILSSDKDLLQLVDDRTHVILMKKGMSEIETVTPTSLKESMGITPMQVIDLKSLMGDTADNIPGVPGVGEKTALKLLESYETLDGVYEHIDEVKGKLKEKLELNKDKAYLSYTLATIKLDAKLPCLSESLKVVEPSKKAIDFFMQYEMERFIKTIKSTPVEKKEIVFEVVESVDASYFEDDTALYFAINNAVERDQHLIGIAFANKDGVVYITKDNMLKDEGVITYLASNKRKVTSDLKNAYHALDKLNLTLQGVASDVCIAGFLLDGKLATLDKLMEHYDDNYQGNYEEVFGKEGKEIVSDEGVISYACVAAHTMFELDDKLADDLSKLEMKGLFDRIEMPLVDVLFEMERTGICVDEAVLDDIAKETEEKINALSSQIYEMAGREFNVNSPKQLGEVLFDDLGLSSGKKRSTAADVLEKLKTVHPIVPLILEQRKYQKVYSTYAIGLSKHIREDQKIHTTYNQTLAQTGRLSSTEPNLQNISVRSEEGKMIRKAFVASPNCMLLSADYSQIELRVLADMANEEKMIDAFKHGVDIHTRTASEIYEVPESEVDATMRRNAKTVNFGIVYGQSDFGLSEQLGISRKEAHDFIEKYFASYPNIKTFMDETIAFCEEHGYVKTMLNRRRYIDEIHDNNYMMREFGKRAAMNAPIQGSAADIIKLAMIEIMQEMKVRGVKSKMILQIHDELMFDVYEDELELMKELVEDGMEHVKKLKVPLLAEPSYAKTWYEAK